MVKLTDSEFETLVSYVHRSFGINLSKKRILIEGRLANTLRERGLTSYDQYLKILFEDKSGLEVTNLVNKITTNHTFFMREMGHFNYMLSKVLPEYEKTKKQKEIRIWSAGCSSGQEPYNIAMAIDDYFGRKRSLWNLRIDATDISENALEKARAGRYTEGDLKDVPQKWKDKYFNKQPDSMYEIDNRIRKDIFFSTLNLNNKFPPLRRYDIIFCRNVMIYFDEETKITLIDKFYDVTAPGGYLFVGHSEVVNRKFTEYQYIMPAIYRKKEAIT